MIIDFKNQVTQRYLEVLSELNESNSFDDK